MSTTRAVRIEVNGQSCTADISVRTTLADFLRHQIQLTGTHLGCEHGVCGACTVLVDGGTVRSCLMLAVQADNAKVTTVEGLAIDGELNVLQQAFRDQHGLQCGFCTPGFIVAVTAFLDKTPDASNDEIRNGLNGNICRCGTYSNVIDAVTNVVKGG